ncbi:EAL domain-containing protein [uncultured Xylophilus sp.]|uniref:bifunctional diguanylate cyclase/phosphodiesterase n=1 Tax=uncultured Xylophilus sp. TaxID=296832 RepID=UPI0025E395A6|nr:EAL domain-containing protein [uncultured Xylophilus sp.]
MDKPAPGEAARAIDSGAVGRQSRTWWEWVGLSMVFAIVLTVGAHLQLEERERIEDAEKERLTGQAAQIANRLGQEVAAVASAVERVRISTVVFDRQDPLHRTSQALQAVQDLVPGIEQLRIVDAKGMVRASNDLAAVGASVADEPLFAAARTSARVTGATPAIRLGSPARPSLTLFRTISRPDGEFDGLVYAVMDRRYVTGVLTSSLYAPDMQVALVDADGTVLGAAPVSGVPEQIAPQSTEPDQLTVWQPLRGEGRMLERALEIRMARSLDAVYAPWAERLQVQLLLAALLAACGAIGLWTLQRRRAARDARDRQRTIDEKAYAERLDFMLSGADVGLLDWNIPEHRIEFNARWCVLLGLPTGGAVHGPDHWFSRVHPEDTARVRASIADHWEGLTAVHEAEYRMRHHSGRWIWVLDRGKVMQRDAAGAPVRMVIAHMDVTQHKRADEALRLSEARFRALTELSSDWYWELDEMHRFVRFEGYSDTQIGMPKEDNIGLTRWDLGALNMTDDDWDAHRAVLDAHEVFHDLELQRLDTAGVVYWVSISGAPIFDASGRFRGYRGIGRSITDRKRVEDEIERLAFYDALTGLPNRRLLLDRLTAALARCRDRGQRGALLFIDLDNFKDLNDTMGHDVGDSLLERVANRLVTCVKSGDTVARLGGDEFVVMLESLPGDEATAVRDARIVGERVLSVLNHPYLLDGYQHHSTPSLGIAVFDGQIRSVDELLKRADLAMYQAKAAGRNTLCFFHPEMQQAVIRRSALEADLRTALDNAELVLYYQPVVDHQAQLTGAEALLRWRHPQRGMVSPGEFIPLAEQTGLILGIGQWVIETACAQLVQWAAEPETRDLTIAVNVSARQFRQLDFAPQVVSILERTGARGDRLKIELTESLLLNDVEDIIAKMGALRARGVGFSLDDFGTGYSSLSYLKRLPLDQLKIDQSFVRDVLTDPNDAAIVRTILALAESLDLAVVAEGVETIGQLDFLTESGCRAFQGYLFGRPAPMQVMLSNLRPISVGH